MSNKLDRIKKQKEFLILQGVEKLKIMGFNNVTVNNILTDEIYHLYFLSFLNNTFHSGNYDEIIAIKELKSLILELFEPYKINKHIKDQ
ncbi:MAG: hypothetical protein ACQEWD_08255 [Bacteroidota bacterium]